MSCVTCWMCNARLCCWCGLLCEDMEYSRIYTIDELGKWIDDLEVRGTLLVVSLARKNADGFEILILAQVLRLVDERRGEARSSCWYLAWSLECFCTKS